MSITYCPTCKTPVSVIDLEECNTCGKTICHNCRGKTNQICIDCENTGNVIF